MPTVLCIDQGSNLAGVTLWQKDGFRSPSKLLASALLKADPKAKYTTRIQQLVPQLTEFLADKPRVELLLFENVRPKLVLVTVGAFLTCPHLDLSLTEYNSFVSSSTWKTWARERGATGPYTKIKGRKALGETGFDMSTIPDSDDVADSVMMFLAWEQKWDGKHA